jgi:hypothetical protein
MLVHLAAARVLPRDGESAGRNPGRELLLARSDRAQRLRVHLDEEVAHGPAREQLVHPREHVQLASLDVDLDDVRRRAEALWRCAISDPRSICTSTARRPLAAPARVVPRPDPTSSHT